MSFEIGMTNPPFGLNLFLVNSLAKDVPMKKAFKGVLWFCAMDVVRVLLVVFIPPICLWLANPK